MEGSNPSSLCTGEDIPGTLSSSHQDRHEATGDSPVQGHEGGENRMCLQGKAERFGTVQSREDSG